MLIPSRPATNCGEHLPRFHASMNCSSVYIISRFSGFGAGCLRIRPRSSPCHRAWKPWLLMPHGCIRAEALAPWLPGRAAEFLSRISRSCRHPLSRRHSTNPSGRRGPSKCAPSGGTTWGSSSWVVRYHRRGSRHVVLPCELTVIGVEHHRIDDRLPELAPQCPLHVCLAGPSREGFARHSPGKSRPQEIERQGHVEQVRFHFLAHSISARL